MLTELSTKNFGLFREGLLNFARRFKVRHEDAEEIVNDAIMKALGNFDNDRGSFEAFCRYVLKNKLLNFLRDNKYLLLLVLIDDDEKLISPEGMTIENEESAIRARELVNKLRSRLNGLELRFFDAMSETAEAGEKLVISEIGRSIDLRPNKAWDVFRKIQRKAAKLKEREELEIMRFEHDMLAEKEPIIRYSRRIVLHKMWEFEPTGFDKFISQLDENDLNKLNELYNY